MLPGHELTISFSMLGKFLTIISSSVYLGPFSFPPGTPIMQVLVHLMLSHRSLDLSSFLLILLSTFCSTAVIFTILSYRSLVIFSVSVILLLILQCTIHLCHMFFSSSGCLLNISCIFSISHLPPRCGSSSVSHYSESFFLEGCLSSPFCSFFFPEVLSCSSSGT